MYNNNYNYSKYEQILKHMKNNIIILLATIFILSCQQETELDTNDISIIHDYREYLTNESLIELEKIQLTNTFDNPWAMEFINERFKQTRNNEEFLISMNG